MAECPASNKDSVIVKCGICLSAFTKPVLLNCFHIFCTPCVTKLVESTNTLICPLCRAVQVLTEKGVDGLTLYPYVEEETQPDTNVIVLCQMCDSDKAAVSNCIDCNSKMCVECSAYHLKHKLFKTHKTENIEIECTKMQSPAAKSLENFTCETHREELSLYCEPCNRAICKKCINQRHKLHRSEPIIFQAQRRRDLLRSAMGAIKSKITGIDQEREMSNIAENNHYKLCRQWKEEIRTQAIRSKETVCKIIDVLADENLQKLEEMQKQDIKSINNFQDELETKKLSLHCLLRSTADIVNRSCDGKLLNDYTFLYQTLNSAVTQGNQLKVFAPHFSFGPQIEYKYIEKCFGLAKRGDHANIMGELESRIYTLPVTCDVTEFTKIGSFTFSNIHSLFGVCEDKTWIVHSVTPWNMMKYVKLYSLHQLDPVLEVQTSMDVQHILRATETELWVKSGENIKKINVGDNTKPEEIIATLTGLKNITCFLLRDNHIIWYSSIGKRFYEININRDWPITVNKTNVKIIKAEEKLAKLITNAPFRITETISNQFVLTSKDKVITLDRNFKMCNFHENIGSDFRGICQDPYGNIFIADYNMNRICLFSSSGKYLHDVSVQETSNPIDITRDSVGNVWVHDSGSYVQIYSYL